MSSSIQAPVGINDFEQEAIAYAGFPHAAMLRLRRISATPATGAAPPTFDLDAGARVSIGRSAAVAKDGGMVIDSTSHLIASMLAS